MDIQKEQIAIFTIGGEATIGMVCKVAVRRPGGQMAFGRSIGAIGVEFENGRQATPIFHARRFLRRIHR